jgi:hypothetical protein
MSLSVVSITLNIRNNRTYPQRINVLGSPVNPLDTANALTEYRWDITAFVPSSSDTLTLEYQSLGASVFSIYTQELSNPNSDALVAALDGLGIGYFNYYVELGQTYLSTFNDDYVFGNLTINSNVTPTTSTTSTTTTAAPTTSTTSTTTTAVPPPTTSTTSTTTTAAPTTSTTSTTTTAAPTTTTSTTSTTTTAAPTTTTSTTSTTTTAAPTTTTSTTSTTTTAAPITTSTTTTTTTLFENLIFDVGSNAAGYTFSTIDVNGITPTLTSGTNVPFSVAVSGFNTNQIGTNETLNIVISAYSLNGCITVTDSALTSTQQPVTGNGTYTFPNLVIDNITPVQVLSLDGVCP